MAFYNFRCRFELGNEKVGSFGLDFETPASLTLAELQDVVDAGDTAVKTGVALFCNDITLVTATIQGFERVANTPPQPAGWHREPTTLLVGSGIADAIGTAAGQSLPPQNSVVVTLRTSAPGRRALGRCYTPPPPEGVVSGSGIVTDFAARASWVQDIAEACEGAIAPVDVDHVVYSLTYDEQNEVVLYSADNVVDTQRRRKSRA